MFTDIKRGSKVIFRRNRGLMVSLFLFYTLILTLWYLLAYYLRFNVSFAIILSNMHFDFLTNRLSSSFISSLIKCELLSPLILGQIEIIYHIADQKPTSFLMLFKWYTNPYLMKKALEINIIPALFNGIYALFYSDIRVNFYLWRSPGLSGMVIFVLAILFILSLFVYAWFFVANCLLADNFDYSFLNVIGRSFCLIRYKIIKYYLFVVSFFAWWIPPTATCVFYDVFIHRFDDSLLSGMVLNVFFAYFMFGVAFYFYPYYHISLALYARKITGKCKMATS